MAKTQKYKLKKNGGLQKTKSCRRSSTSDNCNRKKRNVRLEISPAIKKTENNDDSESDNYDDSVLSNMSKRFWSLLGY